MIGKKAKVKHYPANPADMSASWADTSKARRLLGWSPEYSLDKGIRETVAWYRQEYDWASQVDIE